MTYTIPPLSVRLYRAIVRHSGLFLSRLPLGISPGEIDLKKLHLCYVLKISFAGLDFI